jgi:hypothetical protein
MKAYLCLTFDYEVFLGRNSGGYDDVLFTPTDRLLEALDRLDVPSTFFADVCSVWAHERVGLSEYPRRFGAQLRDAVGAGHDAQLHVHPHWEYATLHDGVWSPTPGKMTLTDFIEDGERPLDDILRDGVDYLLGLVRPSVPLYRCIAFRGPGLALQPREEEILASLMSAGITLDSTVAKGYQLKTDYLKIDYRDCPAAPNWKMSPKGGIRRDAPEGIWQVPIVTFSPGPVDRALFPIRRLRRASQIRGVGLSTKGSTNRALNIARLIVANMRYLSPRTRFLLSPDTKGLTASMLLGGLRNYLSQHSRHAVVCAAVIGHPKLLFAEQLGMLEEFVRRSRDELGVQYVTLTEASNVLNHGGQ